MTVTDLPAVNATLNSCAAVLLVAGFICIKTKHVRAHIACMVSALVVSAAFLTCYLYYHSKVGHVVFPGPASMKTVYGFILWPHIILAVVNVPMIILTVIPALRRRFDKHKRIAPWTLGIWLYVSVTGVIVYMMCYQWFGPPIR
jgi:uncharacterized membrane protein YozB (DUF420 family)